MKNLGLILGVGVGGYLLWRMTKDTSQQGGYNLNENRFLALESRQAEISESVDSLGNTKADNAAVEEVEQGLIDAGNLIQNWGIDLELKADKTEVEGWADEIGGNTNTLLNLGLDLTTYQDKVDTNEDNIIGLQDNVATFQTGLDGKQDAGEYATSDDIVGVQDNVDAIGADLDGFETSVINALDLKQDAGNYATSDDLTDAVSTFETGLAGKQDTGEYALTTDIPTDYYTQAEINNTFATTAQLTALETSLTGVVGDDSEAGFAGNGFGGSIWN